MFKNLFEKEKRSTILFMPEEKRSTIVFMPEKKRLTLLNNIFLKIVLTNLGPKSVDLIFYAPNVENLVFLRIGPKIAL